MVERAEIQDLLVDQEDVLFVQGALDFYDNTTIKDDDIIILNNSSYLSKLSINDNIGTIAEIFGNALRKNPECTYEEMKTGINSYKQEVLRKMPQFGNEEFFERFKNTEYTFNDFKTDYDSMIRTINTPNYE